MIKDEMKNNNNVYCEGEGETLVVNVSFDKFTRINANHKMYYPYNEELEKENAELKTKKITQLERRIASIRGSHRVDVKKLNARIEQVERLKKENAELKEKLGDIQMQKAGEKSDLVWKLKTANEQKALRMKERDELLAELEAKIERMKCCQNCMHYRHYTSDVTECAMSFVVAQNCRHNSFDKWEFKETKEK